MADIRTGVIGWMREQGRPVLFMGDVVEHFGPERVGNVLWDEMIREGVIESTFPEAKPGASGRQFWRLTESADA